MSRRFSISSLVTNSLQSPQVSTRGDGLLRSSLRKSSICIQEEDTLPELPNVSNCDNEVFLKAYNRAKRKSVVISSALDDDVRGCLRSSIKNGRTKCAPGILNEALNPLLAKIEEYETQQLSSSIEQNIKKKTSLTNSLNNHATKPRFGSLLSKEGQYALLKSYEDMIVDELQVIYPELKNHIQRSRTATLSKGNRLRHLSNSSCSDTSSQKSYDGRSNIGSLNNQRNFSISSNNSSTTISSNYGLTRDSIMLQSGSFFDLQDDLNEQSDYEKKMKISQQLEYAMQLIDNLKLIRAAKRRNSKLPSLYLNDETSNPVVKYNEWRDEWTELIDLN